MEKTTSWFLPALLRLVRWPRLLFLAAALLLMQAAVANPILHLYGFPPMLAAWQVVLFVLGLVLITAGGYAINDYFDVKIDRINKPKTQLVGRVVSRQQAMQSHQLLTLLGVVCGVVFAWSVRSWLTGILYVFIPGMLWFYSASYKRQFVVGNLIVAFHAALMVLMVAIVNVAALKARYAGLGEMVMENFGADMNQTLTQSLLPAQLYFWIGGFALMLFLISLMREIVKDMEDEPGDREYECHTLPVKLGHRSTKAIVTVLAVIAAVLAVWGAVLVMRLMPQTSGLSPLVYGLVCLVLPLGLMLWFLWRGQCRNDFRTARSAAEFAAWALMLGSLVLRLG